MDDMHSTSRAALQAFAARDLRAWRGLEPHTTLADVAALFNVDEDWRGAANLGSDRRPTTWLSTMIEGYDKPVRIWLDGDQVLLIDAEYPELATGGVPALIEAIGPPQAKLDAFLGTFMIPESEWVYAERGLTLYINPENNIPLRLAVYPPTTLDGYRERLRMDLQMRRLPMGS